MDLHLSVDIGTTNWKAAAFDSQGNLVALEKKPSMTRYRDGHPYYNANDIWESVCQMLNHLTQKLQGHRFVSIAATGMAESVVAVAQDGTPLSDILVWFDTRPMNYVADFRKHHSDEEMFLKTGLDSNPIFTFFKLNVMLEEDPSLKNRTYKFLQMAEYITYRLCRKAMTDYSLASRTLLFDIRKCQWDPSLVEECGLTQDQFPEVCDAGTVAGYICPDAAAETGLPTSCVVGVGGHDHLCGTIPAGAVTGKNILDSSGTAESFIFVSPSQAELPTAFQGLRVGRYLTKDRYALWGGIIAGGASAEWAFNRFARTPDSIVIPENDLFSYEEFCQQNLQNFPIGSNGLLFIPHLRGAGAPYWDPSGRGCFLGLTTAHTNLMLLHSVMEGLSLQSKLIADTMEKQAGISIRAFNTVGGGARLKFWQQIKADANQRDVLLPEVREATLCGAALLGAIASGYLSSIEEASEISTHITQRIPCRPDRNYDALFHIFETAYAQVRGITSALNSL